MNDHRFKYKTIAFDPHGEKNIKMNKIIITRQVVIVINHFNDLFIYSILHESFTILLSNICRHFELLNN